MIAEAKALADRLNSPSDWSIVLGAATIGGAVDGAINILPIPFFSPGVCALFAASTALSIKRGVEAALLGRSERRKLVILNKEVARCIKQIEDGGEEGEAQDWAWEIELAKSDAVALEALIRKIKLEAQPSYLAESVVRKGFGRTYIDLSRSWPGKNP